MKQKDGMLQSVIRFLGIFGVLTILTTTPAADPAVVQDPLWRFITGGRIRSYPVVGRDGNCYIISDDRFLYSLNQNGEQRWRYYLGERLTDCFAMGFDGTVYVGYKTGVLAAVHGFGKMIWNFDTNETIGQAPAIGTDGTVYCATDEGTLFAIAHTGFLHWKTRLPGKPAAAPTLDADQAIAVSLQNQTFIMLEPWGDIRWTNQLSGIAQSPAIGNNGTLYVATDEGTLYAITAEEGKILWSASPGGMLFSPVIGVDQTVYIPSGNGTLNALRSNGKTRWTLPLGEIPAGPCAIGQSGTLFCATLSSSLIAINPNGRIAWSIPVKGVLTNVVFSQQKVIYAGSSDWAVYAFAGETTAPSAWPAYQHDTYHSGRSKRNLQNTSIFERYKNNADFNYYASLLDSGDPDLMAKALGEIRTVTDAHKMTIMKPFLLYLLRPIAGYTVVEEDRTINFPLRGYSGIREAACRIYSDLARLDAIPLLIAILENDRDTNMKTVAASCLRLLHSDPDGRAQTIMARLIVGDTPAGRDAAFVQEAITSFEAFYDYHGSLSGKAVAALVNVSTGRYSATLRALARTTILKLGKSK